MTKTSTEIVFGIVDITAKEDSQTAMPGNAWLADASDLQGEITEPEKVATLEYGYWQLDGTFPLFPDDPTAREWGLWSAAMSDVSGIFADKPVLTISFTQNHTSIGLTMYFYGDSFPSDIDISWYDGADNLISGGNFRPDSRSYFARNQVADYRKIVITFNAMSKPFRYLKMFNIEYGRTRIFGRGDLITASIYEEVNQLGAEVAISTLNFRAYSDSEEFNIINPGGIYESMQQRQPLTVYEIVDGDKRRQGIFYLDEWESDSEKTVTMKAIDTIGLLDGLTFAGGLYADKSVPALISEIFADTGIDYVLDNAFSAATVTGMIESATCREALQQVAFVIGAVVSTNRQNIIYISPPPQTVSENVANNEKFIGQKITLNPLITGVEVTAHDFSSGGDAQTIYGYYTDDLPANTKQNILSVTDATLVNDDNVLTVAKRIYDYYQNRYKSEFKIVLDKEQAGQIIDNEVYQGRKLRGIIESINIDLTGGYRGSIVFIGTPVT